MTNHEAIFEAVRVKDMVSYAELLDYYLSVVNGPAYSIVAGTLSFPETMTQDTLLRAEKWLDNDKPAHIVICASEPTKLCLRRYW